MLDELIEFENSSKVLDFKYSYKNILIWPYIRNFFYNKIFGNINKHVQMLGGDFKGKYFRDYFELNSFNLPQKDILFSWTSVTLIEDGDKVFDRLIDDFIRFTPEKSAELIGCFREFDTKKLEKRYIFSFDRFIREIIVHESNRAEIAKVDIDIVNEFTEYLKESFPFEIEAGIFDAVRQQALNVLRRFPAFYKYYGKLADIVQPKVVIFHSGMSGKQEIKVLNDLGIITAEYQHGRIVRDYAYMHGKKVAENMEYRSCVPKYFLSWGDYWTQNMNLPMNVYCIGNPTMKRNMERLRKLQQENEFNILFVTESAEPRVYMELIDYILEHTSQEYNITVKLHPRISGKHVYDKKFSGNERVKVVQNGLVYDFLAICKYVIGDTSTVIYEAAALEKKVFVMDTEESREQVSKDFGIWIKDGQDFIEKMNKDEKENKFCSQDYFADDWEGNYTNFLNEVVYGKKNEVIY